MFWKWNFDARVPARVVSVARELKFWNWTSKIKIKKIINKILPDLWLLDLFCPIKKISTLHPTVQFWNLALVKFYLICWGVCMEVVGFKSCFRFPKVYF